MDPLTKVFSNSPLPAQQPANGLTNNVSSNSPPQQLADGPTQTSASFCPVDMTPFSGMSLSPSNLGLHEDKDQNPTTTSFPFPSSLSPSPFPAHSFSSSSENSSNSSAQNDGQSVRAQSGSDIYFGDSILDHLPELGTSPRPADPFSDSQENHDPMTDSSSGQSALQQDLLLPQPLLLQTLWQRLLQLLQFLQPMLPPPQLQQLLQFLQPQQPQQLQDLLEPLKSPQLQQLRELLQRLQPPQLQQLQELLQRLQLLQLQQFEQFQQGLQLLQSLSPEQFQLVVPSAQYPMTDSLGQSAPQQDLPQPQLLQPQQPLSLQQLQQEPPLPSEMSKIHQKPVSTGMMNGPHQMMTPASAPPTSTTGPRQLHSSRKKATMPASQQPTNVELSKELYHQLSQINKNTESLRAEIIKNALEHNNPELIRELKWLEVRVQGSLEKQRAALEGHKSSQANLGNTVRAFQQALTQYNGEYNTLLVPSSLPSREREQIFADMTRIIEQTKSLKTQIENDLVRQPNDVELSMLKTSVEGSLASQEAALARHESSQANSTIVNTVSNFQRWLTRHEDDYKRLKALLEPPIPAIILSVSSTLPQ